MKRLMIVMVLVLTGVLSTTSFAEKTPKVELCHLQNNGAVKLLNINGNALQRHLDHGDFGPSVGCEEPCQEPLPIDFFAGKYLIEQLTGLDPFFAAETFGDTHTVDIMAVANVRSFNFLYYPGIFDSNYKFEMFLCHGEILVRGSINAGSLGCGGANVGFSTSVPASPYDETFISDDVILVNVSDYDPDGNCETGSYPVQLRFTKQN